MPASVGRTPKAAKVDLPPPIKLHFLWLFVSLLNLYTILHFALPVAFFLFLLQFLVDWNSINFICFTLQFPLHFLLSPYLLAHTAASRRKRDVKMLLMVLVVEKKRNEKKRKATASPNSKLGT